MVTWDAGTVTRVWDMAWTVHLGRGGCDPSVGHGVDGHLGCGSCDPSVGHGVDGPPGTREL